MPRERELQRWDAGNDDTFGDMSLDASGGTGWDQFATNERMYGVQSTYDENIYTTQIDYSDPKYKAREEQAARIAREIEGSAPANAHVAEERRQNALQGESGLDEEDKYSGVRREASSLPKRASNAYVPPSQRSITNAPTVPGAPFDPAIISSSLAKPGSSTDRGLEQPKPATSAEALKTPPTEAVAKSSGSATTQQTPAKKTENTTEDHVRGVADSFKQFANNEKLRLRLAQEQKRTAQRAEKNVKLNDLKKFAANFKLNSRIPDDLVPILAKDHDKQKEIQTKAETAWKEEEKRIKDKELEKSSVGAASPAPSASSSAAVTQSGKVEGQSTTFNRNRVSGSGRPPQPIPQMTSPRSNAAAVQNRTYGGHSGFQPRIQPLPDNIRIPTGPAHPAAPMDMGPLSPGAATRLNAGAKAFEFRPAAHAFTPTGTTPSPRREVVAEQKDFFKKKKSALAKLKEEKGVAYSPVKSAQDESPKDSKSELASRGGVPHAFRTAPTWMKENQEFVSYTKSIPQAPTPSQTHSQMHTPNPNSGQMPHAHQLPPHMQGPQATPSRGPQYLPPQHMPPNMPPHHQGQFGPGMHGFAGNGSVQSSPRFSGAQVAFSGQVPVPQFSGQQFNGQQMQQMGMQGYGMSPSMGYRSVNMPPGAQGQMMMMGPGGQGGHGQSEFSLTFFHAVESALLTETVPIPPYGRGPQQFPPNMMPGSVPMNQQGSAQGGYPMQPPMPGQHPGQQSYSPMPPHATPHMQHHQHMQQSPYAASPRPAHMMQHTTSHQGFNPQGPMGHMQGPQGAYAPSPGMQHGYPGQQGQQGQQGWHGYGMGQRQMSHGAQGPPQGPYPGMTPRQGQAVPNMPMQPSPGQGQRAEGDEGK